MMISGLIGLVALACGGAIGWLLAVVRIRSSLDQTVREAALSAAAASADAKAVRSELEARKLEADQARLHLREAEAALAAVTSREAVTRQRLDEEHRMLAEIELKFAETFKALAADALKSSNESFLTLAGERLNSAHKQAINDLDARRIAIENIVAPARDSLVKLDVELRRMEENRRGAHDVLTTQLQSLASQTNRLVDALKTPNVRGRWGEIQLKRVVEIAGMVERCDFFEQAGVTTADGRLRPDMRIQLPGGKCVVVDAKVPLRGYMEALDAVNEAERTARLRDHARQIRSHVEQLSSKSYWDAFEQAPEFVVLFLPGEMFFSAALQEDPALIEDAASRKVILATPTTLIALLKAVAYGWRQEQLAENAGRISELGRQLHERLATMTDHFGKVGRSLHNAVDDFNRAVGSFEGRVLPAARRFRELAVGGKQEISILEPIDGVPRDLSTASTENGIGK
ncbi:MAG TPA: DNA recombination protein RmuC [Candidatus Binataceae bacterium]|nr:DNA recombination protein RmuC [Candidatus Binataceae bacterium]